MPFDIVTPPISSAIASQDRWQVHLPRGNRTSESGQESLFQRAAAAETAPVQTQPVGSSIAYLAQSLAQASNTRLSHGTAIPAVKAASAAQRYEIAGSRDVILRGESILFRFSA